MGGWNARERRVRAGCTHSHQCDLIESVLSRQINDLEPMLARHGYRLRELAEQFDAKPAEIRGLFNGTLDATRTAQLRDRMLLAGLPIAAKSSS